MDVNAIYYGDDDFSGKSENLGGPLNMNGSRIDGEKVQWDGAFAVSDPGLGRDADTKESFLTEGETLTVELPGISSLDEIDVLGVRATSTSTEDGSIKGVSDDPEEPEEPEDPVFDKVFFGNNYEDASDAMGAFVLAEEPDPNTFGVPSLPEGTEPTFDNYVDYYVSDLGGDITTVEAVIFFDNNAEELFRLEAPEGGFAGADELLMAYDDFLDTQSGALSGVDLMAALTLPPDDTDAAEPMPEDDDIDDEVDII